MPTEFTVTELKNDTNMGILLACLEAEMEPTAEDSIWQILINGKVALFLILPTSSGKPQLYSSSAELLKVHPQLTSVITGDSNDTTDNNKGWMAKLERENVDHAIDYVVSERSGKLVGLLYTDFMHNCSRTFFPVLVHEHDVASVTHIMPDVTFSYPETIWRRLKQFTDSFIAIDPKSEWNNTFHASACVLLTDDNM